MTKPFQYPTTSWHNVRYTYADGTVKTDFEISLEDAVNTALFERTPLDNLRKVEYAGTLYVGAWTDETVAFKRAYEGTALSYA